MRKRGRILIMVTAVIAVGIIASVFFAARSAPPEPVYKGKPLSYWLHGYSFSLNNPNSPDWADADAAVKSAGTNAIPLLIEMLRARDSSLKLSIASWGVRLHVLRPHRVWKAEELQMEAMTGLQSLVTSGAEVRQTVPDLVRIIDQNRGLRTSLCASATLFGMGPPAAGAVPCLVRAATSTNLMLRRNAVAALGRIQANPKVVVPVLVTALHDPDPILRDGAASSLTYFGKDASPAVPALVAILSEPIGGSNSVPLWSGDTRNVRATAKRVLREIDPETYARVITNGAPIQSPQR